MNNVSHYFSETDAGHGIFWAHSPVDQLRKLDHTLRQIAVDPQGDTIKAAADTLRQIAVDLDNQFGSASDAAGQADYDAAQVNQLAMFEQQLVE